MSETTTAPKVYTAEQVCELLQVKRSWLYDEVQAGRFPHCRIGRQLRFRPSDIENYLEQMYRPAQ